MEKTKSRVRLEEHFAATRELDQKYHARENRESADRLHWLITRNHYRTKLAETDWTAFWSLEQAEELLKRARGSINTESYLANYPFDEFFSVNLEPAAYNMLTLVEGIKYKADPKA